MRDGGAPPQRSHLLLSGDDVPAKESAIVLANHQQMPDITWLMDFAKRKGRLGDLKWFVKDAIKWVPGVGWGMVFLDCLFVKRDWASDATTIAQTFERILQDDIPLWLVVFPEGTRFSPEKLAKADAFADEAGLARTEHVLQARTAGFVASVQGLRGHVDAIYDVTIGYEEGVPSLWQFIKGQNRVAHMHVERIAIADLPESAEELGSWLHARFQLKDRRLDAFYRDGAFLELPTTTDQQEVTTDEEPARVAGANGRRTQALSGEALDRPDNPGNGGASADPKQVFDSEGEAATVVELFG
jgi:lysocardiolipin and lysophospholipid acyltransferase